MKRLCLGMAILLCALQLCACAGEKNPTVDTAPATDALTDGETPLSSDDPLAITGFVIGESVGEARAVTEKGETRYVIYITLPVDTDFKRCIANIELAPGASVSSQSPCVVDDLGGRPVLNLTLDPRTLIVVNGAKERAYEFEIGLG
ncbi:MAG: hypothetical protein ACOX3P_02010 [Saccharofermentanales bacterium]|jgi:hypothetical protein|nr:hypothetical protein [Bacillota bacterium]NLB09450.1 hypothetical protein [Clostridiales bacterium]